MFRIGEFSQLGQVSVRMLRHYDELGLLKPAHVDPSTDYRHYAIEQLPRLHRIMALKELGLSLEQIVQFLNSELSAEQLRGMLRLKQAELHQHLQATESRLNRVEARLQQIEQEDQLSPYEVILKSVAAREIASIRQIVPTAQAMPSSRHQLSDELYGWLHRQKVVPKGPELVLYHLAEYREVDIDLEFGVILGQRLEPASPQAATQFPVTTRELPAITLIASVVHSGMLRDIVQAITALYRWIGTNGYRQVGAFREIHLFGRESEYVCLRDQPVVVELQIPIAPHDLDLASAVKNRG